ncbi:MAG: proline dehydrogenase family protein [Patescibacteria group bacterium]
MFSSLVFFAIYVLGLPRWLIMLFYGILLLLIFWNLYRLLRNNYIAAKTEEKALQVFKLLLKRGFFVISDIVGEQVKIKNEAWRAKDRYISHIHSIKHEGERVAISIKPSQCGLYVNINNPELCRKIISSIISQAYLNNIFVWIDAEKKQDREDVFRILFFLKSKARNWRGDNFGVALQANHSDARQFLEKYLKFNIPVRLVKGAYTDGDLKGPAIDENFYNLVDYCDEYAVENPNAVFLSLGTHDKDLIFYAGNSVKEFQFLFGVNCDLAEKMVKAGKRVVIYAPWGQNAGAYLYRRFREGIRFTTFFLFLRNLWSGYRFRKRLARLS